MASYINRKARMFLDGGDLPVLPKRSEGRMKTYFSATDARAWCDDTEDRRQYIIELIKRDVAKGVHLGKYVPIEVLIDTLLANKNAEIERLRQLLADYESLELTDEQRAKLAKLRKEREKTEKELAVLDEEAASKPEELENRTYRFAEEVEPVEGDGEKSEQPGEQDGEQLEEDGGQLGEEDAGQSGLPGTEGDTDAEATEGGVSDVEGLTTDEDGAPIEEDTTEDVVTEEDLDKPAVEEVPSGEMIISKDAEIIALKNALAAKTQEWLEQRELATRAIEQLENLKNIVEERDQLQRKLRDSQHEIQRLKQDLPSAAARTEAPGKQFPGPGMSGPEVDELANLEKEIQDMRGQGTLTCDQEADAIRKEVECLKRYCAKLGNIQVENAQLKRERDSLKAQLAKMGGGTGGNKNTTSVPNTSSSAEDLQARVSTLTEERDRLRARVQQLENELLAYSDLPEEVEVFKERSRILDDVIEERNSLHTRLEKLKNLEPEVIELKKRADRADQLEKELTELKRELNSGRKSSKDCESRLKDMEDERNALRMKVADYANIDQEMERLRYRAKEAEVLRIERDRLKIRCEELAAIEAEYIDLLNKTRCLETIKAERDMYKAKYEEILGLECECDILRAQLEKAKQVFAERDALQREVRECECKMADQEDDIKRLVSHVDRLTQGRDEQQEKMKAALGNIRGELEAKNSLINQSEEQLATVQNQLKATISSIEAETAALKKRIGELEAELESTKCQLRYAETQAAEADQLRQIIKEMNAKSPTVDELMKRELEQARAENEKLKALAEKMGMVPDEHLEAMLKESKTALSKVKEDLIECICPQDKVRENREAVQKLKDKEKEKPISQSSLTQTPPKVQSATNTEGGIEPDPLIAQLKLEIKRLQDELAKANETIAKLRSQVSGVERVSSENSSLRRHSKEMQDLARAQIEELIEKLRKAEAALADCKAENDKLRQHLEGVPGQLVDSESLENLRRELESVKAAKEKLEDYIKNKEGDGTAGDDQALSLMADKSALEEQLQKEIKLRQSLEAKIKELEDRIKDLEAGGDSKELDDLRSQVEALKQLNSRLQAEKQACEDMVNQLKADKDNLEKQLSAALEGDDVAAQQLKELEALRREKENLMKQVEQQNIELAQALQSAKDGQPEATVPPDNTQELLEKERREKQALADTIAQLEKQLSGLSPAPSGDNDKINSLEATIDDLRKQLAEANKLTGALQSAEEKINNLQAIIDDLTRKLEEANKRPGEAPPTGDSDLLITIEDLKKKLEEANKKVETSNALQAAIDDLKKQLEEANKKVRELQNTIDDLTKKLEEANKKAAPGDQDDSKINDLEKQLADALTERNSCRESMKAMEDALASKDPDGAMKALQEALDKANKENAELKKQLEDCETSNLDLKEKLAKAVGEVERVRNAQAEAQEDFKKKLEDAIKANMSDEDKAALDAMKSACEDEIDRLKKELERLKQEHNDTISSLKAQYEANIKNVNNKHDNGIQKIQESHASVVQEIVEDHEKEVSGLKEELRKSKESLKQVASLKEELRKSKESLKQVSGLKDQLRKSKESLKSLEKVRQGLNDEVAKLTEAGSIRSGQRSPALSKKTLENVDIKSKTSSLAAAVQAAPPQDSAETQSPPQPQSDVKTSTDDKKKKPTCTCGPNWEDILEKLRNDGFEALTFEELHFIHSKTSAATNILLQKGGARSRTPETFREPDKAALMRKVIELESQLIKKQRHAQKKIADLNKGIKEERYRLQELKNRLDEERQYNGQLLSNIRQQKSQQHGNVQKLVNMMEHEKNRARALQEQLEAERGNVMMLQNFLHSTDINYPGIQGTAAGGLDSLQLSFQKQITEHMKLGVGVEDVMNRPRSSRGRERCSPGTYPANYTSTFYTELAVDDPKQQHHFIHECCMRRSDKRKSSAER